MISKFPGIALLVAAILLKTDVSYAASEPKPKPPIGIKLPEDRLTLMAGNHLGATFIEADTVTWKGRIATVMTYTVFEPPHAIAPGKIVVQAVNRHRIDCDARTRQEFLALTTRTPHDC